MPSSRQVRVAFTILADAHKIGDSGKLDCFGIFDHILVWATPALRECSIAFGLVNVPQGDSKVSFWLDSAEHTPVKLGELALTAALPSSTLITAARLQLNVTQLGQQRLAVVSGARHTGRHLASFPLSVSLQPWPELPSGEELQRVLRDPTTMKSARAVFKCGECGSEYTFQINLDPSEALPRGARPFPLDGVFVCPKCATKHFTRDIEGQIRFQLGRSTTGVRA